MVRPGGSTGVGTATAAGVPAGTVPAGCGNGGGSAEGRDRSAGRETSSTREQGTEAVRAAYDRTAAEGGAADRDSAPPRSAKVRTVMEFGDFGTGVKAEAPPSRQVTDPIRKAIERGQTQNRSVSYRRQRP